MSQLARMLPTWVPGRAWLVDFTGVFEIAGAHALCRPSWRVSTGHVLIVRPLLFPLVNIDAALRHVDLGARPTRRLIATRSVERIGECLYDCRRVH